MFSSHFTIEIVKGIQVAPINGFGGKHGILEHALLERAVAAVQAEFGALGSHGKAPRPGQLDQTCAVDYA